MGSFLNLLRDCCDDCFILFFMKSSDFGLEFLDSNYGEKVSLTREYYICPENKTFEGPAGLKVFFNNIKDAQKYCEILNKGE